jgi:hypothetical protein
MVGSSSVLATLAAQSVALTAISGVVALAGSVLAFIADFTTRLGHESKKTVFDTYLQLSKCRYRAEQLRGELTVQLEAGITQKRGDAVVQLIGETNALCLEVDEALATLLIS